MLRVLDTHTGQFVQINHMSTSYAILSHTWDHEKGEQTFQELQEIQRRYAPKPGASLQNGVHGQHVLLSTIESQGGPSRISFPFPPITPVSPSISSADASIARLNEQMALLADRLSSMERRISVESSHQAESAALAPCIVTQHHSRPSASPSPEPPTSEIVIPDAADPLAQGFSPFLPRDISTDNRAQVPLLPIWDDPELSPKIKMACTQEYIAPAGSGWRRRPAEAPRAINDNHRACHPDSNGQ